MKFAVWAWLVLCCSPTLLATRMAVIKELRWLAAAALVYILLCVVMLVLQPQMSIEPVGMSRQLHSLEEGREGRGRRVGGYEGLGLSHMGTLLRSHMFTEQGIKLKWIGERIKRMSGSWEKTQRDLALEKGFLFTHSKRILLFPGLLSEYSAYDFANNAYKGGYLGELVQWSDLIATLHMLGHHLVIHTSKKQLTERVRLSEPMFDLVFTDYIGLFALRDSKHFPLYKCRIRVLDSFGTEPLYNFRTKEFEADSTLSMFSNWNFEDLRQFWTLFPHTPDNSFLGFVVEPVTMATDVEKKKNQGVIYGKEDYYAYGKEHYLNTLGEAIELHSTFKTRGRALPPHVVNHGVLPQNDLRKLLQESKVFVGLGFPYDGPGPFEALASGCSFIQPRFIPPHNGKNVPFLRGKPTSRELTSQVPYLEHYVGEPHVYTLDVRNSSAVRQAVYNIISRKNTQPFIPHEFTQQGMMERVGMYIIHQNFCDGEDLARGRPATSSSSHAEHDPGEAVDGLLTEETCFWSAPDDSHWWMVDLGADLAISKIRITNTFEWVLAKSWGVVFPNPFVVTLTDSHGNQVVSRVFNDSRTFYLWEEVGQRARFVRLDSLEYTSVRYLVLCAVEVFGADSTHVTWPDLTLMHMIKSSPGQSCKEACFKQNMVCEPAYFRALNKETVVRKVFNCSAGTVAMETYHVDFPPAVTVRRDEMTGVSPGTCVTNSNSMLLSCAGHHQSYQRLCPCRKFIRGQIAVPPPL